MKTKPVTYYNRKIEALKATIRRLNAEKRIAILKEKELALKKLATKGGVDDE